MKISQKYLFLLSFIAFICSGFAGLIYQSVWTRYLSLILGHAAFAQTLVLALFMGGMALGAWWASKLTNNANFSVLKWYAIIEVVIGVFALAFHFIFVNGTEIVQTAVLPRFESETLTSMIKWSWAASLIFPQCILLGMTFPLLSAGLIRASNHVNGEVLGTLYFTNSIGAAIGALVSTFYLIPAFGLPGAVIAAGVFNMVAAALVFLPATQERSSVSQSTPPSLQSGLLYKHAHLILWCAFFTGLSSFVYEIAWVRMLSLALGSTIHAFEIMISSFVAGLAFGSFWIRKRIDKHREPLLIAGYAQILMGCAALTTIFTYQLAFSGVENLLSALAPTSNGYLLFNISSAAIAIALLFPTAFFAGMTLPVFTTCLLKVGTGEQAIGRVYAVNTIGAIAGVFIAVHLLIPYLGLKSAILIAAAIDIILGVMIFKAFASTNRARYMAAVCGGTLVVLLTAMAPKLDQRILASGVFRYRTAALDEKTKVAFYRDGKTASISALVDGTTISIATNGKVDAAIQMRPELPPSADEETMTLLGMMPMLYNPSATTGATIGFGSGLSTHTVLGNPKLKSLDTIEIEPAIVEAAQIFGERVSRAYTDPRSNIIIADAKTYFSGHKKRYDFIVSEPSNPWVSGVSSLFSEEFYRFLPRHLNDGGILVQWIQLYEIDFDVIASILKALGNHFEDYDVYFSTGGDLVIVAKHKGQLDIKSNALLISPNLIAELKAQGLSALGDYNLRYLANKSLLNPLISQTNIPSNSDFNPIVSHLAPKTRFMRSSAAALNELSQATIPFAEILAPERALPRAFDGISKRTLNSKVLTAMHAEKLGVALGKRGDTANITHRGHLANLTLLNLSKTSCHNALPNDMALAAAVNIGATVATSAPTAMATAVLSSDWLGCSRGALPLHFVIASDYFNAIARRDIDQMILNGRLVLENDQLRSQESIAEIALCGAALGLIKKQNFQAASQMLEQYRDLPFTRENRALRMLLIAMVEARLNPKN